MSEAKLKPCPLCGSTNIRMLEPELLDTDAWNCAIECLDCRVHIGPSYCEPDPLTVPQAWLDVQAERRRQIAVEGFDTSNDDASAGQIALAAGCYALHAGGIGTDWPGGIRNGSALFWPWDEEWWKPKSARENLVRAGALVLAEIERLDRSATEQGSTCCKGSA